MPQGCAFCVRVSVYPDPVLVHHLTTTKNKNRESKEIMCSFAQSKIVYHRLVGQTSRKMVVCRWVFPSVEGSLGDMVVVVARIR